jgi:hypothetical protein
LPIWRRAEGFLNVLIAKPKEAPSAERVDEWPVLYERLVTSGVSCPRWQPGRRLRTNSAHDPAADAIWPVAQMLQALCTRSNISEGDESVTRIRKSVSTAGSGMAQPAAY